MSDIPHCIQSAMNEKANNRILSFPRSGISWFFLRLNRFLLHRFGIEDTSPAGRFLVHSHLGYLPHHDLSVTHHSQRNGLKFIPETKITVLLRDAKSVLSSVYHYRRRDIVGYDDSADVFLRSNEGVSCVCAFMNDIELIVKRAAKTNWDLRFLYYEDMLKPEFVDTLPSLLGMGCKLTDTEREAITEDSNFIVHPSEMKDRFADVDVSHQLTKYQKTFGQEGADYVDRFMRDNCVLDAYNDRYPKGGGQ